MASATSKEDNKDVGSKRESKVTKPSLNMDELRELADLVDEHGFTDFEFENEKIRVRLSKAVTITAAPAVIQTGSQTVAASQDIATTPVASSTIPAESIEIDADDGLVKIPSTIVGTFYRSPGPDNPPFVKEGDQVSPDTVVCIIEAMKLMNEIEAEVSGEIVKIYVEDAQPVEFGQPLFGIRK